MAEQGTDLLRNQHFRIQKPACTSQLIYVLHLLVDWLTHVCLCVGFHRPQCTEVWGRIYRNRSLLPPKVLEIRVRTSGLLAWYPHLVNHFHLAAQCLSFKNLKIVTYHAFSWKCQLLNLSVVVRLSCSYPSPIETLLWLTVIHMYRLNYIPRQILKELLSNKSISSCRTFIITGQSNCICWLYW